jgi:2-iminobutanoate/2-iminopropanoate deaminase
MLFLSGQLGLDPESGVLLEGVEAQTQQAVENLKAVLAEAGTSLERIVKTTIFVTDLANFAKVNEIYGAAFTEDPPARSTVEVSALPLGGLVEIEAIALVD